MISFCSRQNENENKLFQFCTAFGPAVCFYLKQIVDDFRAVNILQTKKQIVNQVIDVVHISTSIKLID
jgi:hypothetical protein